MPNAPLPLAPHERAALERGPVLLLRPVAITDARDDSELRKLVFDAEDHTFYLGFPPHAENVRMCGFYAKCDAPPGEGHVSRRVLCPLGWIDDVLATEAGPVRVVSVRVERCAELTAHDVLDAGALRLPNRPTYEQECADAKAIGERMSPVGDGPVRRVRRHWATLYPAHSWEQAWCWAVTVERSAE